MMRETIEAWLAAEPVFRQAARFVCAEGAIVYLVGGTVRDLLAGRAGYDMDLAVVHDGPRAGHPAAARRPPETPAMSLGRRLADALGGAYVALDAERDVARVVVRRGGKTRIVDLAGLRAGGIDADLRARDFTANALGVSLCAPEEGLLDPTGGREDLAASTLRMTHSAAFQDDPLRILRGVRLRGTLGWRVASETERRMRVEAPLLALVSPERVRDELAQILALEDAAESLSYAEGLEVLGPCLPGLEASARRTGIAAVAALEALPGELRGETRGGVRPGGLPADLAAPIRAHWAEELSGGRTRWLALKLAALLVALGDRAQGVADDLRLSAREVKQVAGAIAAARALADRDPTAGAPSRLEAHRYFRAYGEAGVAGAVLSLAIAEGARAARREVAARLLRAWFAEREDVVDPPPLVSGREVMEALGIAPGRGVGQALEALREAQAQGLVRTREEALACLRERNT